MWQLGFLLGRNINESREEIDKKREKAILEFSLSLLGLFPYLFKFKSEAFYEELEWRLLRFVVANYYSGYKFRSVENKVVPYSDIDCSLLKRPFIKEVILGPKHETPIPIMRGFLKENGFPDVDIVKSSATYR